MITEKTLLGIGSFSTAIAAFDYNLGMAIIGILLVMILAPRYFSNRALRAENDQLKGALDTHTKVKEADDLRVRQLETDLAGTSARANAAKEECIELRSKYDALKPFTAEPAFRQIEGILERIDKRDEGTHDLLRRLAGELSVLGATTDVAADQNDIP